MNRIEDMSEAELLASIERLEAERATLVETERVRDAEREVERLALADRMALRQERISSLEKELDEVNARLRASMRPIAVIRRIPETEWNLTRGKA